MSEGQEEPKPAHVVSANDLDERRRVADHRDAVADERKAALEQREIETATREARDEGRAVETRRVLTDAAGRDDLADARDTAADDRNMPQASTCS